jgi:hypothetical protein
MSARTYQIQRGDTLGMIAHRLVGNAGRWGELAVENPGLEPRRLKIGQVLRLPDSWNVPDTGATTPQDEPTRPEIYTWKTLADGTLEVNGRVPSLGGASAKLFDTQCARWLDVARRMGAIYRVPWYWILGMIYRESGGNPAAIAPDGGLGLMQITSTAAKAGHTDQEVLDPATNVQLGARLIAAQRRAGDTIVEAASKFNAGAEGTGAPHPSSVSPWGYRETAGHISAVVAAANYALRSLGSAIVNAAPQGSGAGLVALGLGVALWRLLA